MPKILIIDDDPDIVMAVRLTLENKGYQVESAENSRVGLEKMKQSAPDLIILDVMMDTTTEGFQFAIKLRNPDPSSDYKKFKAIPILMLTAIHQTTPLRFGPDEDYLPVELFVEKPVDPEYLVTKVQNLL